MVYSSVLPFILGACFSPFEFLDGLTSLLSSATVRTTLHQQSKHMLGSRKQRLIRRRPSQTLGLAAGAVQYTILYVAVAPASFPCGCSWMCAGCPADSACELFEPSTWRFVKLDVWLWDRTFAPDYGTHGRQPQFGEDNYMVGVSKFLSAWAPNMSSLVAYFLSMLSTWSDQTFALVLCSLTGLPQLLDVPRVLRCFGLLLIGVRNWSMVWTTGLGSFIAAPLVFLLGMLVFLGTTNGDCEVQDETDTELDKR